MCCRGQTGGRRPPGRKLSRPWPCRAACIGGPDGSAGCVCPVARECKERLCRSFVALFKLVMVSAHEFPARLVGVDAAEEAQALFHLRLEAVMQEHRVVKKVRAGDAYC